MHAPALNTPVELTREMHPDAIRAHAHVIAEQPESEQRSFVGYVADISVALAHEVIRIIEDHRDIHTSSLSEGC